MSAVNGTMVQLFQWYTPSDGSHWESVRARAPDLTRAGMTAAWLPPAFKGAAGSNDVGYGAYDLYDLGEFDQKGGVRTKYGTRGQYLAAIRALQSAGMQVYADTVLNQKEGGDGIERVRATPYFREDRNQPAGEPEEVEVWTRFTFPGREGRYSPFEWSWQHFDAVNYARNRADGRGTVYLFEGHRFDDYVSQEKGNYAFLLGCDLDMQNEDVRQELLRWGRWYLDTTGVDGLRLDAIKHISSWFFIQWLDEMRSHAAKDLFVVGEYWSPDVQTLHRYIGATGGRMSIFDVPLHFNFHRASRSGGAFDMRRLLEGTLMQQQPALAVTFVDNHDSQPLQALESPVDPWFKPLAYATILLRREGYPCLFLADYDGAEYEDRGVRIALPSHRPILDVLLAARRRFAFGEQLDWFDHPDVVGWARLGDEQHPKALAVLMSDGPGGSKWMEVRRPGAVFHDLTGHDTGTVTANGQGWAEFRTGGGSVSVWVEG
jgi:alpha-amylase